jgi:hypothetical protein
MIACGREAKPKSVGQFQKYATGSNGTARQSGQDKHLKLHFYLHRPLEPIAELAIGHMPGPISKGKP